MDLTFEEEKLIRELGYTDDEVEDLRRGPGIETSNTGDIILRNFEVVGDKLRVTKYMGPPDRLSEDDQLRVVREGILYDPAIKHYAYMAHVKEVYCDLCKTVATVVIGLETKDLCLKCVDNIKRENNI